MLPENGAWHSFWGECLKMSVLTEWSTFKCSLASHPGQKTVVYIYRFDILCVFINLLLKGECIPPEVGFLQGLPCYQKVGPWHSFWGECLKMSVLTEWSTFKCSSASHPGQKTVVYIYCISFFPSLLTCYSRGSVFPRKWVFFRGFHATRKWGLAFFLGRVS